MTRKEDDPKAMTWVEQYLSLTTSGSNYLRILLHRFSSSPLRHRDQSELFAELCTFATLRQIVFAT
jgi:hypothetical protein